MQLFGNKLDYLRADSELLACYTFYATILILKLLIMSPITSYLRIKKGVVSSPEDTLWGSIPKGSGDPEIERVRRAHQNDLENVLPFLLVGGLYVLTLGARADLACARWHFRLFTGARIAHTVVYLLGLRQPLRAGFWTLAWLATVSMAFQTLWAVAP